MHCYGRTSGRSLPVGFQNSATSPDLGFLCGPLVFVDEAAEDGTALDLLLGEVRDRVVRTGRVEMAAAVGAASVVVGFVPSISMTNRQYRRCRVTAQSTWKKSVASIVDAWVCRNCRHVVPVRRCGAGGFSGP